MESNGEEGNRILKVVGRYKAVYEYDSSDKVKDLDGTAYPLKNRSGCKVKILDKVYCTKAKEQEISNAMAGKNTWHGQRIVDMVYSHGKFTGIVYETVQSTPAPSGPSGPAPSPAGPSPAMPPGYERREQPPVNPRMANNSIFDASWMKILYVILVGVVMAALTHYVLFDVYLNIIASAFSEQLADSCYTFNFSGITGMIGGLIGMVIVLKLAYGIGGILYYIFEPVGYLIGMVVLFSLVTILILLVKAVYSVFIAIIPILLIIGAIIFMLKSAVKK